jgi:SagB-type dehydrogenase family enzyme
MTSITQRRRAPLQGGRLFQSEGPATAVPADRELVLAYHERTKHRLERYAAGPEALDWSAQPDPFRRFAGCPTISLPLLADGLTTPYDALHQPDAVPPRPLTLDSVGMLLELSLGLSAWKEYGPDRWALRCNPSSGNLHPTEGYVISQGIAGLDDGTYHYVSRDHLLEQRCRQPGTRPPVGPQQLLIGLSSVQWREAWKYGERAFRYCQLDVGHAIGALRYAAAALGWGLRLVEGLSSDQVEHRLGLDRHHDFAGAEPEEGELLLEVVVSPARSTMAADTATALTGADSEPEWRGRANVLDPHPMYHWPVIDEVARATRFPHLRSALSVTEQAPPPLPVMDSIPAAALIRQRRSAQRFDPRYEMTRRDFFLLLDCLLPRASAPWDVWRFAPAVHPVFFIHRVEGLEPGLYVLPRRAEAEVHLRAAMNSEFAWKATPDCPDHLRFFQLATAACAPLAKAVNCHQAIAADGSFAVGMLSEFEATVTASPWRYRQLYWEAGLLGQALYMEAERIGLRGTGIGCYFDDRFHEILGLSGNAFQSLYHFTVGYPVIDTRILSLPPYPERA